MVKKTPVGVKVGEQWFDTKGAAERFAISERKRKSILAIRRATKLTWTQRPGAFVYENLFTRRTRKEG